VVLPLSPHLTLGDRIRQLPSFDFAAELASIEQEHSNKLIHSERIIEQGIAPNDVTYKLYEDVLGIAYIDPFAFFILKDAVLAITAQIANTI
jgi:hypothetical protein